MVQRGSGGGLEVLYEPAGVRLLRLPLAALFLFPLARCLTATRALVPAPALPPLRLVPGGGGLGGFSSTRRGGGGA
eukprot:6002769-Pyramimonas_sp.AAC.1